MKNPIYPKISNNIPSYIKEEYPKLHNLVVAYFKWLETDENFLSILVNFKDDFEVNSQIKPYIDMLKAELGWTYNIQLTIDDRTLIKLLRDFYLSRGSEQSFKLLYKILFNANVDIFYPRDKLFKLSDNNYIIEHKIITTAANFENNHAYFLQFFNKEILSTTITGLNSGLIAIVDSAKLITKNRKKYLEIKISRTNNDFIPFEYIQISNELGTITETIFAKLTYDILDPGHGYKSGDILNITFDQTINENSIVGGETAVDLISTGGIDAVGINFTYINGIKTFYKGQNYVTGDKVIISSQDGSGVGFDAKIVTTDTQRALVQLTKVDGGIDDIILDLAGRGYINAPKLFIKDTRYPNIASGAEFIVEPPIKNYIGDVAIISGGTGYIGSTINLIFSAPLQGGTTAVGTASIVNGVIVEVTLSNSGSLYDTEILPTITAAGGGTGAILVPIMMGDITQDLITKVNPGANYSVSHTAVTFDYPDSNQTAINQIPTVDSISFIDGLLIPEIVIPGLGYKTAPSYVLNGVTGGSNFTMTVGLDENSITIEDFTPGVGYAGTETVTFDPPPKLGEIEYINVVNPGYGFNDIDSVVLDVESVNGTGAQLYPLSATIGQINSLKENTKYSFLADINDDPKIITGKFTNNESANILIKYNSCIERQTRHNENLNGILETNCYLHDSYYYQQFSYVTSGNYPIKYGKEIIEDLLHPVGFLKFDNFIARLESELNILPITADAYFTLVNHWNVLITDFDYISADFVPEWFYDNSFTMKIDNITDKIDEPEGIIVFGINNIIDDIFVSNFTLPIETYKNHRVDDFDGTTILSEFGALDITITIT